MTGRNEPSVKSRSSDAACLAAQEMEVLCRGGAVDDADVLLRGELEKALQARARMFRPIALVAVREQKRQT